MSRRHRLQPVKSKAYLPARGVAETGTRCSSIGEMITWTESRFGEATPPGHRRGEAVVSVRILRSQPHSATPGTTAGAVFLENSRGPACRH